MKNKKYLTLLLCLLITLTAYPAEKDFNVGIDYTGHYTDNIFMNASGVRDYVSQFQGDLNLSLDKFNLYLGASADIYSDNGGFNSFSIEPGIEYRQLLKGRNSITLGLGYAVLQYKDLYTDFNYSGPRFHAEAKFYVAPQTIFKANYRFQSNNYANYQSFDFYNHTASMELHRFFKSQTTLRLQGGFNFRYYPHIAGDYNFGNNYNYYGGGSRGQGHTHPPFPGQNQRFNTMGIPNIYGLLRITQGIGTGLGITGEGEIRKIFRGIDPGDGATLVKNAYILYPFNDDYLWDGLRLSLGLKAVLFKKLSVEGTVSYFDKYYPGIYVMGEDGNAVEPLTAREDTLLYCRLKITRKIRRFSLFANFAYRDNNSSDNYFLYKMIAISAGIGVYF